MNPEDCRATSPIVSIFHELQAMRPNWAVKMGCPSGRGWIAGTDLKTATEGPFHTLLSHTGERLHTTDRRTIAASFVLRYGWSSGIAMAPYILHHCVPRISLDNVSFKFHENTLFECAALHAPEGFMLRQDEVAPHPCVQVLTSPQALLGCLRESLVQQARPIVEALDEWSHFSRKGMWGLITSSWGSQFLNIYGEVGEQTRGLRFVRHLFEGNDVVSQMQPAFYPVTYKHVTHVYHRRASCCRYYRLPQGDYCASCPIIPQEARLERNRTWMKHLLDTH